MGVHLAREARHLPHRRSALGLCRGGGIPHPHQLPPQLVLPRLHRAYGLDGGARALHGMQGGEWRGWQKKSALHWRLNTVRWPWCVICTPTTLCGPTLSKRHSSADMRSDRSCPRPSQPSACSWRQDTCRDGRRRGVTWVPAAHQLSMQAQSTALTAQQTLQALAVWQCPQQPQTHPVLQCSHALHQVGGLLHLRLAQDGL